MRLTALGLVLTLLTGCAVVAIVGAAAVGTGTYAYVNGELKREYPAPLDHTWAATVESLQALEVEVIDSDKDQAGGRIEGLWYEKSTKLTFESKPDEITLVKIRVGTFGDRDASEQIGNEIQKRL